MKVEGIVHATAPAIESPALEPAAESETDAAPTAPAIPEDTNEENIYEVMKAHMRRQKEELDAKNAQAKIQQRQTGRPGMPQRPGQAPPPTPAVVEVLADTSNLANVWQATRRHLDSNSTTKRLETVIGPYCSLVSLNRITGETVLSVPANYQNFTSENARTKIEESLRLLTALPIKLAIQFVEEDPTQKAAAEASRNAGNTPASRVPPEVLDAVKKQPLIQELMKKLDATVVNVEMTDSAD